MLLWYKLNDKACPFINSILTIPNELLLQNLNMIRKYSDAVEMQGQMLGFAGVGQDVVRPTLQDPVFNRCPQQR